MWSSAREAEAALREGDFGKVDVAIDFTVADAVPRNLPLLAERGINVVIGTTGWAAHERELRDLVDHGRASACSRRRISRSV